MHKNIEITTAFAPKLPIDVLPSFEMKNSKKQAEMLGTEKKLEKKWKVELEKISARQVKKCKIA